MSTLSGSAYELVVYPILSDKQEAMNAYMLAVHYGPEGSEGAIKAIVQAGEKLPNITARDAMYSAMNRIDWKKLEEGIENLDEFKDAMKGSGGPFAYLGRTNSTARAAAMMFEQIAKAQEAGLDILAIEKRIDLKDASGVHILNKDKSTKVRDVDLVLKTEKNGKVKYIELKGWGKTVTINDVEIGAVKWMKNQINNTGSQIYKDIILFATERADLNIGKFEGIQWYIKSEGMDALGGVSKLTDDVLAGVEANKSYFSEIMGIPVDDKIEWNRFMQSLEESMTRSGDEFFKVVD